VLLPAILVAPSAASTPASVPLSVFPLSVVHRTATPSPREAAQDALAVVEAAFSTASTRQRGAGSGPRVGDLTMALLDLHRRLDDLSSADQARAAAYLARPVDGALDPERFGYRKGARPASDCEVSPTPDSRVCVIWVTNAGDADAPALADRDGDGVPNQVERTRDVVNRVWEEVVVRGGYSPPVDDGTGPLGTGTDGRLDVYLADLGALQYYGYCAAETRRVLGAAPAYCVLDDDFSRRQFPGRTTPVENLRVTAAHEFFHAVQFAYDVGEDIWFMEGTAAWIEDEVFDAIDDNRQYLAQSPLTQPSIPLDHTSQDRHPYGNWVFWRYLTERYPAARVASSSIPDLVRRVWERARYTDAAHPGTYSVAALVRTLGSARVGFPAVFAAFGATNRRPAHGYEEGRAYPVAPLAGRATLSRATRATAWRAIRVRQLANATVAFVPGRGLGAAGWRLRVAVHGLTSAPGAVARLTVHRAGGRVTSRLVPLRAHRTRARTVAFSTPEVRRVELTLTNASTRFLCDRDTGRACRGVAKDDRGTTRYRATVVGPGRR
jgi:hypothetical protein